MRRPARAAVAFTAAAALVSQTPAQQPVALPPTYSTVPDVHPLLKRVTYKDGSIGPIEVDWEAVHVHLCDLADRPLRPDATAAEKVRSFQLKAGVEYLFAAHRRYSVGALQSYHVFPLVRMVNDVYRAAGDAEPDPAARRRLSEERVRALKVVEQLEAGRVERGFDPLMWLEHVRNHRLRAEAELLAAPAPN